MRAASPYQHRVEASGSDGIVEARAGRAADGTVAARTFPAQRRLEAGVDGGLGAAGV